MEVLVRVVRRSVLEVGKLDRSVACPAVSGLVGEVMRVAAIGTGWRIAQPMIDVDSRAIDDVVVPRAARRLPVVMVVMVRPFVMMLAKPAAIIIMSIVLVVMVMMVMVVVIVVIVAIHIHRDVHERGVDVAMAIAGGVAEGIVERT